MDSSQEPVGSGIETGGRAKLPSRRGLSNAKRKLEDEMAAIFRQIQEKESEMKLLVHSGEDPNLLALRQEREKTIEERRKIDEQLQAQSKEIDSKRDAFGKLQSKLDYKNEERLQQAIKKLEFQISTKNYTPSEERKIVQEIDRLKRTKKALQEYQMVKEELDRLRDKNKAMRTHRDSLFHKVKSIKHKEDEHRKKTQADKVQADQLKKEVDELYERRRQLQSKLKKLLHDLNLLRDQQRQQSHESQAQAQSSRETRQPIDPNAVKLQLCSTLLGYLTRCYGNSPATTPAGLESISQPDTPASPVVTEFEDGGATYVLMKKDEDTMYSGLPSRCKKAKDKKKDKSKKIVQKPINHPPEIFEQFSDLEVPVPYKLCEVSSAIEQLKAKQKYYKRLVQQSNDEGECRELVASASEESTDNEPPGAGSVEAQASQPQPPPPVIVTSPDEDPPPPEDPKDSGTEEEEDETAPTEQQTTEAIKAPSLISLLQNSGIRRQMSTVEELSECDSINSLGSSPSSSTCDMERSSALDEDAEVIYPLANGHVLARTVNNNNSDNFNNNFRRLVCGDETDSARLNGNFKSIHRPPMERSPNVFSTVL